MYEDVLLLVTVAVVPESIIRCLLVVRVVAHPIVPLSPDRVIAASGPIPKEVKSFVAVMNIEP